MAYIFMDVRKKTVKISILILPNKSNKTKKVSIVNFREWIDHNKQTNKLKYTNKIKKSSKVKKSMKYEH